LPIRLPVAMGCERESLRAWFAPLRSINKITQYEECKGDEEIMLDLGKRLNPEMFPFENVHEFNEYCMENLSSIPFQMTVDELKEKTLVYENFEYLEIRERFAARRR
jgi:hypothetical protein